MKRPSGWRYWLTAALAIALAACGGATQMLPAGEAPVMEPGQALVVFMRPSAFGGIVASSVFDVTTSETRFIGIVYSGNKFAHAVPPGEHTFMVVGESADFMRATVVSDRTYYALVTPRLGIARARFSFRPVRQHEVAGAEFVGWNAATEFVSNSPASLGWAVRNAADIGLKRARYWPEWTSKPEHQRLSQTLNAGDGVETALATAAVPFPAARTALPRPGDSWTYDLLEPKRRDGAKLRTYSVRVATASSSEIVDRTTLDDGPDEEWTHKPKREIVTLGKSLFNPYLLQFGAQPAGSLGARDILDCTSEYVCHASARVAAKERTRVPAGVFDTVKVVIEQSWRAANRGATLGANMQGGRTLTVWYSAEAKRAVKFSSRATYGYVGPIDTDFDLVLTSFQLH